MIERDLHKCLSISNYDPTISDCIRHSYLQFNPFQPKIKLYPMPKYSPKSQPHASSKNWLKNEQCKEIPFPRWMNDNSQVLQVFTTNFSILLGSRDVYFESFILTSILK